MPTVPTSFVPQVADTGAGQIVPFEATPGQPMQNLAPEQQVKMGAAMTDAGNVMFRIGSTMQDKMNEAAAKEADTRMFAASQEILRGQNGYFTTMGKDADTRFADTQSALAGAANNILDSLGNDTQRRMFQNAAARNLAVYNGQMQDHRNKQVMQYEMAGAKARTDTYIGQAIDSYRMRNMREVGPDGTEVMTGPFSTSEQVAIRETRKLGAMLGIPENSDQMRVMEQSVYTSITEGVTRRLMTDNQYQDALDYIKQQQKSGKLESKAGEDLLAKVTVARKSQMAQELAESIRNRGTLDTPAGTGNFITPVNDASQIVRTKDGIWEYTVKPFTPVVAPADGKVVEERDDARFGHTMVIEFEDGTKGTFSGINTMGAIAIGKPVQRHMMLGVPENQAEGKASFGYSLERNGRLIDPAAINSLNQRGVPDKARPPRDMSEAIDMAKDIADPDVRKATIGMIRERYGQEAAAENARVERVEIDIAKAMANGEPPPPQLMAQLPPDRASKILTERRKQTSLDVEVKMAIDGAWSREQIMAHRDEMTPQAFVAALNKADTVNLSEAKIDADQINAYFDRNGMSKYARPSSDAEKQEALRLRMAIEGQIRAAQSAKGKSLSWDEKQAILDKLMLDKASVQQSLLGIDRLWADYDKPIAFMTPGEMESAYIPVNGERVNLAAIPAEFRMDAIATARRKRETIGESDIAAAWIRAGKPAKWEVGQ